MYPRYLGLRGYRRDSSNQARRDMIANKYKARRNSSMSSLCAMVAGKRRGVGPTLLLAWCSLIFPLRNSAYVLTRPMVPSGSMNTGIRARGRGVREGIKNNLMGCGFSGMRLGEVEDLLGKGTGRLLGLSMVFDQFDPRGRSKLVGRTYASDPALFEDVATLKKRSTWTDPLIFCDQTASSPTTGGALASGAVRSIVAVMGFFLFPELTNTLSPLMFTKDVVLSDEVRVGLTSSFLPGVSLLFGALFSYTISLLVNRLTKIEEIVNAELAALYVLVMQLQDFFRYDRSNLAACMEAFWRHTDSLIFQSRYQEILLLVQEDPLEDIMRMIISVDDDMLAEEDRRSKSGVDRDLLGYLRGVTTELIKLRMTRLSYEGRVLPPAHFGILIILASMLLFGFTLASTRPPSPEGLVQTAFESQVLFTLLLFSFSVLLEFALDLTNPFVGRYKVRRTTTTAILIKIRSEIIAVMGTRHMSNFDEEFVKQKRRALRDFRRNTGMALPLDGQI